jgi:hypothetical protein
MESIKREAKRAQLDIYANKIIDHEPYLAKVRDISPEGVYLYRLLEPEFPVSKPIGLELKLPDSSNVIWAVGKVVRRDDQELTNGSAVRFTHIAESDRQTIRDYIDSHDGATEADWADAA